MSDRHEREAATDIDPALLRALAAVKQTGGFTAAASRLNLTQSAISHQIRRLERLVGRILVERTTREVALTGEGEAFLACGHKVLVALDELDRRFGRRQVRGLVRLGVPDNFLGHALPDVLARFGARFPDVQLTVTVGMSLALEALVAAGDLDLAVVMTVGGSDEGALRVDQLVWAAAILFRDNRPRSRWRCSHRPAPTATWPWRCWPGRDGPGTSRSQAPARRASWLPSEPAWRSRCWAGRS